ncbi:MAG TPA: DNRLRE domain-containing protein, partial [Trebonia sp.]
MPVQQTGTAAGRSHSVSAAADTGRVVDGKVVPYSLSASRRTAGPVAGSSALVPGAVSAASKPKALKLPAKGKPAPETLKTLKAPAPAAKTGYNAKTSKALPPTNANQILYSNADGTRTSFQFQAPVNYKKPDGSWTSISTTLVPAGHAGSAAASASASPSASVSPAATPDAWFETPEAASPAATPPSTAAAVPSASAVPPASASPSPSSAPSSAIAASLSPSPSASGASPAGWTEKSEADPESFAGNASAADLVSAPVDGSHVVAFGISGAQPAAGEASGSTVTYDGVRSDSSVQFSAGTGMVKESIVLSSSSAPDTWVFPLGLKGLTAEMGPGGIVEFADSAGRVLAYVPPGFMSDSKIDPHSGDGATSYGVTYSLTAVGGRQAIRMTLDKSWLDSPDRVYPVTVDPSVKDEYTDGTTYVQYPDDNDFSGDTEIHAGTYDGGSDKAKSFLSFPDVASGLKNDTVLGARLGVFNTWSYSCSPREVYVYPVTSSWSVTGDKSWPGPSTGSAVGRASFATGWVPLGSTSSPCPASWEGIRLDQAGTNLVNGWTHGSADNGLALGASDSDSYAWKKFGSDSSSGGNPFLAVTYTTDGARYSLGSRTPVANVTPTGNGKIAVKVTNTGSSTWTSSNGYEISYRAYNARGQEVANHPVFTAMPSTVSPGQTVTVDVAVNSLPAGSYALDFDMYSGATGSSPVSFSSQGIAPYAMGLSVPEPPPVVSAVYPPTGFTSTTLQQQLSTSATGDGTLKYDFTLTCEPLAGQTCADSSVSSGSISTPYWTPPAADLDWDIPYEWSVTVSVTSGSDTSTTTVGPVGIEADVPQPSVTSSLGGSSGQAYDPLSGNYTTSATDAAVKSAGPALEIDRTYNSLDPRTSGAFGAGWSSLADASLADDTANSKTVLVTLPTGQQMRFGENGDGSYAAPEGSPDALKGSSSASWTLRDSAGNRYAFTGAGQLTSITDENGYAQDFAYNSSNQLTTITDAISGRTLTLTWSTPSGASYPHVATVATQAPGSGDAAYTWTYSYTGDELTQACAPAVSGSGCTAYTYGSGSQYEQSVQDADPRVDWQLGENGDQAARDTVITNLGNDLGTYHNVTQGVAGPLAGSSQTAASFDGTDSSVSLPSGLISEDTDVSVGLWFKAGSSSTGGVLYGYSTDSLSNSGGNSAHHVPALYIGANGELYGEFYNGSADPLHASSSVEDGNWHYAVLSGDSSSQSLFLDGSLVGTLSGQIDQLNQTVDTIGAGFWESWPEDTQGGTA